MNSHEGAVTRPLYPYFIQESLKLLDKIKTDNDYLFPISYVLLMTGFEHYLKSKILIKYQHKPTLLLSCIENPSNRICYDFSCKVRKEYGDIEFKHFNLPYELFKEFSIKKRFMGLLKWLDELYKLSGFQKIEFLLELINLRNLFVHYWEFPIAAQYTNEDGKSINMSNIFERDIERLDATLLFNALDTFIEYINYLNDDDVDLTKNIKQNKFYRGRNTSLKKCPLKFW